MDVAASLFKRALETSTTAMLVLKCGFSGQQTVYANSAFKDLTGFNSDDLAWHGLRTLHGAGTDPRSVALLYTAMSAGQELRLVLRSYRIDRSSFWNLLHLIPFLDENDATINYIAMLRDVTAERSYSQRLRRRAHCDPLTGLSNRYFLYDRLDQVIARAQHDGSSFAVVFVDLNRFKQFNDAFGHALGDELLRLIAARLAHCVREGDTVSRYGGDEFVMLLPQEAPRLDVAVIGNRIRQALERPVVIDRQQIGVACSIGVSQFPADGRDRTSLLRQADVAMFRDKAPRNVPLACLWHETEEQGLEREAAFRTSPHCSIELCSIRCPYVFHARPAIAPPRAGDNAYLQ